MEQPFLGASRGTGSYHLTGIKFPFLQIETVLEMDGGDGGTTM